MKKKNALLKSAKDREPNLYTKTPSEEFISKLFTRSAIGAGIGSLGNVAMRKNPAKGALLGAGGGALLTVGESLLDSTKTNRKRKADEYAAESKRIHNQLKSKKEDLMSDRLKRVLGGSLMLAPAGAMLGSAYTFKPKNHYRNVLIGSGIGAAAGAGLGMLGNKNNKKK
jgi:hypothetical protein